LGLSDLINYSYNQKKKKVSGRVDTIITRKERKI
jgi:hypothetical protein